MKQNLVIITGPTAVGKSEISIMVAKKLGCEIISTDSAQVYRYMDIGTAKLKNKDMNGVKHYMIDEVLPDKTFSVAMFRDKAEEYITRIAKQNKIPMLVGGTGLYINSLLNNLDFTSSIIDEDYREDLRNLAIEKGNIHLHNLLKEIDPSSYERIHPNDVKRVIRALEVYKHTNRPISYFQNRSKEEPCKYRFAYVCLTMERKRIYKRINQRTEDMIDKGLIEEVENLLKMGYNKDLVSMQAIGYKEIASFLLGEITKEEAINILKTNTRRYAKRQLTWFRADKRVHWVNIDEYSDKEEVAEAVTSYAIEKLSLI